MQRVARPTFDLQQVRRSQELKLSLHTPPLLNVYYYTCWGADEVPIRSVTGLPGGLLCGSHGSHTQTPYCARQRAQMCEEARCET